jgi:DNA mismatch repair protein MutS
VVARARDILKNLESAEYNEYGLPNIAGPGAAQSIAAAQMELFAGRRSSEEESVLDEMRRMDPERLSPLDALLRLSEWKERMLKGKP